MKQDLHEWLVTSMMLSAICRILGLCLPASPSQTHAGVVDIHGIYSFFLSLSLSLPACVSRILLPCPARTGFFPAATSQL